MSHIISPSFCALHLFVHTSPFAVKSGIHTLSRTLISCYKSRLLTLQLLPLSQWLELLDIMFLVINLKILSHISIYSVMCNMSDPKLDPPHKINFNAPYTHPSTVSTFSTLTGLFEFYAHARSNCYQALS